MNIFTNEKTFARTDYWMWQVILCVLATLAAYMAVKGLDAEAMVFALVIVILNWRVAYRRCNDISSRYKWVLFIATVIATFTIPIAPWLFLGTWPSEEVKGA